MADETKRVIDQTTDSSLSAGDFIIVDSQSEGTRKFDLGTELTGIKQDLAEFKYGGGGVTDEARLALMQFLSKVALIDTHGQEYYDTLFNALFPVATLTSITAVYTQSGTVYTHDSLDSLKSDLVVTAHYDDASSQVVTLYTLSGTLSAGTSTITVSYGGKTTTFNVTVTDGVPSAYTIYDYILRHGTWTGTLASNKLIKLKKYDDLNALSCEFWYKASVGHTAGQCIFGSRDGTGSSKSYAFYSGTDTLGYHQHGVDSNPTAEAIDGIVHHVEYNNPSASPSTISVDGNTPIQIPWTSDLTLNISPSILTNKPDDSSAMGIAWDTYCGRIIFYDVDGNCVGDYFPCVRSSDSVIGMYDIVEQTFYTSSVSSSCTIGNNDQRFEVGNWS